MRGWKPSLFLFDEWDEFFYWGTHYVMLNEGPIEPYRPRGVEWTQAPRGAFQRALDLLGSVHGWERRVELYHYRHHCLLEPDVLLQDVASVFRSHRPSEHTLHRAALLRASVEQLDRSCC